MFRTLVLGGYGNFGARIVRALAADDAQTVVVAGRDAQRAQALAVQVGPQAEALTLAGSLNARSTLGGTAPVQVRAQIERHHARLG